jgi:hypothetical protein
MSTPMLAPQVVFDAWADMASWVESSFPAAVMKSGMAGWSQDVGDIGACSALNSPGGDSSEQWSGDGDATVTLSNLTIATFSGTTVQPGLDGVEVNGVVVQTYTRPDVIPNTINRWSPPPPDPTPAMQVVSLPLSFATLEVTGDYGYRQHCALYDAGKSTDHATTTGSGTISQTLTDGTITYTVALGLTVELNGVSVDGGKLSTNLTPSESGSWITNLLDFYSDDGAVADMRSQLGSSFATAGFTTTLMTTLNQQLQSS